MFEPNYIPGVIFELLSLTWSLDIQGDIQDHLKYDHLKGHTSRQQYRDNT